MPSIQLVMDANERVIGLGEDTVEVARQAGLAEASATAAAVSEATAEAAAGPTYASTATGLAATSNGEAFAVDNGDGTVSVYRNDGGAAAPQRTLFTTAYAASAAGAGAIGLSEGETVQDFASRFSFQDDPNGDNLTINPDVNAIASDLSASVIVGGGNSANRNLIGYLDYYTEIAGDGSNNVFTSTFDASDTALVGVFLIRADGVRVQIDGLANISIAIVGGKAQVTYPTSGNTNNGPGGTTGSDPKVLSTERIVIVYRVATENIGSLSDYSGIFGSYDNVIQQGVMQHIVSHAHGRITGGDHNLIAGGSYHRKTAGAYGALVGGTGVKYGASGSGGGTLGATLSVFSGTGPQWGLGASLTMSGAFAGAGGTNVTISGNGSWAFGRSLTISGQDSFAGGSGNSVVGAYSAAFGLTNTCAGGYGLSLGRTNTNSGAYSVTVGRSNATTGDWALTTGYSASNPHDFSHAIGGESFAAVGDCQSTVMVARAQTTNATLTAMRLGAATQRISIPDQTTWAFEALIVARRTDADDESAGYKITGVIDRQTGAGTTALVGTPTVTVLAEDTAAWDATVVADSSTGALEFRVQGEASKTIRWVARVALSEVSG